MIKVQGISGRGGQTVITAGIASTTTAIRSFPLSTITVYYTGTTNLVPIFTDAAGTIAKSNPFVSNSDASFGFYVAAGRYDLRFSGTGITTPFTLSDIEVGTPGETPAEAYASLLAAVTDIGATPTTLVISTANFPSGGSCTVPATTTLEFRGAGTLLRGTGHAINIKSNGKQWPIQKLFYGLGTTNFNDNYNIADLYPEWWGAVADDSTDSYAAIQAAETALESIGTITGRGRGTLHFDGGIYLTSAAIIPLEVKGICWRGAGKINTVIKATGTDSAVRTNGCWYSRFIGMTITTTNALSSKGVFELDGNYDLSHTQGVQGNSFYDFLCVANGSTYALTLLRQGGSGGQGDSNNFYNLHLQGGTEASYYQNGLNTINNNFYGIDVQAYAKHGMKITGGSINLFGFSFESTNAYTQILNGGWDIDASTSGVYEKCIIAGGRSESLRFFNGSSAQGAVITGFNYTPAAAYVWTANAAVALNTVTFQFAANGSIKFYRVTTSGMSAGSAPTWPNTSTVADGTAVWTQTALTVVNLPTFGSVDSTGFIGFPIPLGIPGNFLALGNVGVVNATTASLTAMISDEFIPVDTTGGNRTVVLPDGATTPQCPNGKKFYIKKTTTDANTVTVSAGGNGIDGAATAVIPAGSRGYLIVEYDVSASMFWILAKSF